MAFDLSSISKTKRVRSPKIVVVGQGKIGKTTFAAMSPNAIGILTEDGADAVDANAFPNGKAAEEIRQLYKWACKHVNMQTYKKRRTAA